MWLWLFERLEALNEALNEVQRDEVESNIQAAQEKSLRNLFEVSAWEGVGEKDVRQPKGRPA